jgi:hypothetical protein
VAVRKWWLDLFTGQTWAEFLTAGASTSGFRPSRRKSVQKIKPGDHLICYMTGISRFVGLLEVVSDPYEDETRIWRDEVFPCRVRVKPIVSLTPETGVPVQELLPRFSWYPRLKSPVAWTGWFRGSPVEWNYTDGQIVAGAIVAASKDPVTRPVDKAKLARKPKATQSPIGPVVVPEPEPHVSGETADEEPAKGPSDHTEIQYLLAKLGSDIGLDVWIAKNDRGREFGGQRLADIPRLRSELPLKFDPATNRIVELIDVLWLRQNAVMAAFEVESTTSIYSGLLRMGDLIALQPNLNIPLYIVAPDDRREKVIAEVNRPTFARLETPMAQICQYISFSALRAGLAQVRPFVRRLNPDVIRDWAEPCVLDDD